MCCVLARFRPDTHGQDKTFLQILRPGTRDALRSLDVFLSLGFEHEKVQLCATCQKMVRSETGSAGVMLGAPGGLVGEWIESFLEWKVTVTISSVRQQL